METTLRPSSLPVGRSLVLALVATVAVIAVAACDGGPAPAPTVAAPGRTVDPSTTWARGDFGARPVPTSSAGPASLSTADPLALADLLRAVPRLGKTHAGAHPEGTRLRARQRLVAIEGSIPSPFERPSGCPFHPRCSRALAGKCETLVPVVTQLENQHSVRCLLYELEGAHD